jgi:hypothetical protein
MREPSTCITGRPLGKPPTQLPTHGGIFGTQIEILQENIYSVFKELAEAA